MTCCTETSCRRKNPILLHRGPFSLRWFAVTRYSGQTIHEKHDLGDEANALLEAGRVAQGRAAAWRVKAQEILDSPKEGLWQGPAAVAAATALRSCADEIDPPEST